MAALLINTSFWTLVLLLLYPRQATWTKTIAFLRTRVITAALVGGAVVNVIFVMAVGYVNPRDYVQDVVAAHQFLRGQTLYPKDLPQMGIEELSAPVAGQRFLEQLPPVRQEFATLREPPAPGNAHPPLVGILWSIPVGLLGLRYSFLAIAVVSLWLLWVSLRAIVSRLFGPIGGGQLLWLAGLVFGWYQVDTTIRGGQPSILILGLVCIAWVTLRQGSSSWGGVALAVATHLHAFPALLGIWCVFRRRVAAMWFVSAGAAIGLGIALLLGLGTYLEWLSTIRGISELFVPRVGNISLAGVVATLLQALGMEPMPGLVGPLCFVITAAGMTALLVFRSEGKDVRTADLEFSMFVVAMLLASPISWPRYFPILLLPIAVLVRELKNQMAGPPRSLYVLLLGLAVPGSALDVPYQRVAMLSPLAGWMVGALPTAAVLALLVWLIRTRLARSVTEG